jgi:hypothetical protein
MQSLDALASLTPLQRAIWDAEQLGLTLRDSTRLVTSRMGFFVGQHKYLQERAKVAQLLASQGLNEPPPGGLDPTAKPRGTGHQIGSP